MAKFTYDYVRMLVCMCVYIKKIGDEQDLIDYHGKPQANVGINLDVLPGRLGLQVYHQLD